MVTLLGFVLSVECFALAPVPEPEPRIEWDWSELEGSIEGHFQDAVFSPDGKFVASAAKDQIFVWSVETHKRINKMQLPKPDHTIRLAFSADGKQLISDCRTDTYFRFWDIKTGKQVRELNRKEPLKNGENRLKALSPDGKYAIDQKWDSEPRLEIIDLAQGNIRAAAKDREYSPDAWAEVAFAPDGKSFVYNGPQNRLRIFETETGKLIRELRPSVISTGPGSSWLRSYVRYSPDGRYIMACEHAGRGRSFDQYRHVIWGVEDGKRYWEKLDKSGWISGGNRYLISDAMSVYDLITEQQVPIGKSTTDNRRFIGMSADGSMLAFQGVSNNRTQSVIYLTPAPILAPVIRPGAKLSTDDTKKIWDGVVSGNLLRRNHSCKVLAAQPEFAVQVAQSHLQPVPKADAERIEKLIRELDDDSPDVRDKAQTDLIQLGRRFDSKIDTALKSAKPGEVRNRLTVISCNVVELGLPDDLAADLRAVAFLEELKTPEARKYLKVIADGAEGSKLTLEATSALKRIGQ